MKLFRATALAALTIALFLCPSLAIAQLTSPTVNARTYLPGDFVHIVVDAPADTSQISATMPDGATLSLIQDRRTNVWRGIWQVPIDFKKGTYSVKLSAVDVQGNVFEGQTDTFSVGELALITLVGKPTKEAVLEKPPLRQLITAEAPTARVTGQEELISLIKKIVTPAAVTPVPALTVATKNQLVARNLAAGKEDIRQGKFSEAAAFFRVVLYLDPNNKEAGVLLADTMNRLAIQKKTQEAETRRFYLLLAGIVFLAVAALAAWFYYLLYFMARRKAVCPPEAAVSGEEKQKKWYQKRGWSKDPFAPDILRQISLNISKLEHEGLNKLIAAQIEQVGGRRTEPFSEAALEKIYELSKGAVKTAIGICDWAVNQAISKDQDEITAELVKEYEKLGQVNILIADDDEVVRASLEAILKKGGGYRTDFAFDGEEALRKVKENLYNLVLLDIAMPKMDGYKVLREIRNIYPELPVVFVTGKGTPQQTLESMAKLNLNGYIEKPFTPEKVLDSVARILGI